ncbi:protection of telomeres protein 1a-like isoform X2 [Actinidia eriantha]|uniref:protection of telomeres protein 1a-like isoform X2 n=1 Tax=Actinidia eriantha TaxID=165200 RepID=UPI0025844D8C|nr:protection of telomeres protein 1a-like isoform X2 [Actinidia eriantha]
MSDRRYIMPVRDVKNHLNRKVNLIALVVEFSIPRRSEGTDFCTILKVIDQSQQSPELSVNIFMDNIHQLPHIRSQRDIIFLSCVRVDSDKRFISSLRNWCLTFQLDAGISEYLVSLNNVKAREFVDLFCKVLGVYEVSSNEWVILLWDGTDVPPLSLNTKLEEHESIRLQIESAPLPTNVLGKFPCVGTVLRVIADRSYGKLGEHFNNIGYWVRIRNVLCETDSGLWKGFLTSKSKVRLLSENDNNVIERKRKLTERLSLWGRVPMSSYDISNYLTVTDYEIAKFATLMDLLTFSKDKGRFKCVVRIVAMCPWHAKDFRSPAGLYRIRVTLEDPTSRIHALLCAEDAEMFFGGYPSVEELGAKMNKLLGVTEDEDSPRNPPWMQCCIEIHSSNEAGASRSRHYHIRFTKLVL